MSWSDLFLLSPDQRQRHRLHLVGIGGTGLAPIARVLLQMGFRVSGSDQKASERTGALAEMGAWVALGHDARHLYADERGLPDVVLITSAVSAGPSPTANPEVQAALAAGVPVVKRSQLLGPLTADRRVIAVAGTHGKTTTTGMIAHLLSAAGLEPGYIIGSPVHGLGISSAGRGDFFVIEADEYDYAFLGLHPQIIVLTSLEWDHPDCFPTPTLYEDAFRQFVRQLQPGGSVIYCQDDARLHALAAEFAREPHLGAAEKPDASWRGYGSRAGAAWRIEEVAIHPEGAHFVLSAPNGQRQPVDLCVPGIHNALNAAGALLAAQQAGVALAPAAAWLPGFHGAGRRFERVGEHGGIMVIDDYAHHPTEIRATLAAARAAYPDRDIWAIYQPHTYSRTRALLDDYEGVFAAADYVLITDIFAAREPWDPTITAAQVAAASRHPHALAIGDLPDALAYLAAHVQDPPQGAVQTSSLIIILSAGSATELGPALIQRLRERS